jgi:hypothetical protein
MDSSSFFPNSTAVWDFLFVVTKNHKLSGNLLFILLLENCRFKKYLYIVDEFYQEKPWLISIGTRRTRGPVAAPAIRDQQVSTIRPRAAAIQTRATQARATIAYRAAIRGRSRSPAASRVHSHRALRTPQSPIGRRARRRRGAFGRHVYEEEENLLGFKQLRYGAVFFFN